MAAKGMVGEGAPLLVCLLPCLAGSTDGRLVGALAVEERTRFDEEDDDGSGGGGISKMPDRGAGSWKRCRGEGGTELRSGIVDDISFQNPSFG